GTDNHLFLLDVAGRGLTGKLAEGLLDRAGITVNKNTIPFDTNSPMVASGIRIGTAAVSTRGLGAAEMDRTAGWIAEVLAAAAAGGDGDAAAAAAPVCQRVRGEVRELCRRFPLHAGPA